MFLTLNFLTNKLALSTVDTNQSSVKLTYDVEHRFEENNKLGIVLADLTAAHDSILYDWGDVGPINHPYSSAPL